MAEKLKQVQAYDPFAAIQEKETKRQKEQKIADKKKSLQEGIDRLATKAAENQMKFGDEDFRTQFSLMFIDVALNMEQVISTMESMQVALSYLDDAIGFVDLSIGFADDLFTSSLEQNYGFFARMRQRRKMRKAIKNNCLRMNAAMERVSGTFSMAGNMVSSLQKSFTKLKTRMNSINAKNKKKAEKQAKRGDVSTSGIASSPEAVKLMNDKIASMKKGDDGSAPAPSGSSSSTSGSGGIDDIYM